MATQHDQKQCLHTAAVSCLLTTQLFPAALASLLEACNTVRDVLLCKINAYLPVFEHGVVEVPVSALRILFAVKLAEAKAFWFACFSVHDEPATAEQAPKRCFLPPIQQS